VLNTNSSDVSGATLYVTMFPCNECAKLLIQAGLSTVVFFEVRAATGCHFHDVAATHVHTASTTRLRASIACIKFNGPDVERS
jgi:dCMP deaminase